MGMEHRLAHTLSFLGQDIQNISGPFWKFHIGMIIQTRYCDTGATNSQLVGGNVIKFTGSAPVDNEVKGEGGAADSEEEDGEHMVGQPGEEQGRGAGGVPHHHQHA